MSNVKSWGMFLSGLNHAGKAGKVIKTIPDFSPDADPEMVKFNIALANAKKNGHYVITRKSKDAEYVSLTADDLAPFLNNEYVGVLTTKNADIFISEFKKISTREFVKGTEYQPLEEVSAIEPVESDTKKEYKNFNKALDAAATYQVIVKDKNGYDNEAKGVDVLKKFIKYKYFGFFSRKPNLLEYVRFGYRKLSDEAEAPLIFGGKDESNNGPINIGEFLKIETKIAEEPKKNKSAKGPFSKTLKKIDVNALGYIKRKSAKTGYEYEAKGQGILFANNKTYPTKMIDGFMNNQYSAIVAKDTIYEYMKIDSRPITANMDISDALIEKLKRDGVWEGDKWETESFNKVLQDSVVMVRSKDGFEGDKLTKEQTSFIERLVKDEIPYFAVRSTTDKLYEFILIDKRDRKTANEEPVIYRK